MALTRKFLKALGIEEDKVEEIITAHSESVDALKQQIETFKTDADKLQSVQMELDKLKAEGGSYKEMYETEKSAHEQLQTEIANRESKAKLERAVRSFYEGKGITGNHLNIAMRGTALDGLELEGDALKDTSVLDELVAGDFAALVGTKGTQGANPSTPPAAGAQKKFTAQDIKNMSSEEINKNWEAIKSSLGNM